jgi:hypothetical protein
MPKTAEAVFFVGVDVIQITDNSHFWPRSLRKTVFILKETSNFSLDLP